MSGAYSSLEIDLGSQTRTYYCRAAPKCLAKSIRRAKASLAVIVVSICIVAGCFWVWRFMENRGASLPSQSANLLTSLKLEPCDATSSLEEEQGPVIGLEYCPELEPMVPTFVEIKRSLLRLAIDAATDAGESPLMLVERLIEERADLLFSSTNLGRKRGKAQGWLAEQHPARRNTKSRFKTDLFLDRIEEFYLKYLRQSRPVVVYVNGPDLCTFYDELTTRAGPKSTLGEDVDLQIVAESEVEGASAVVGDKTPLVLMTLGWDNNGSPFTPHWRECSMKVLELPEVVRWVVSHSNGNPPSPKVKFVPIGFGGMDTKSGLPQSHVVGYSQEKLRRLQSCPSGEKMEMLFMCNNNSSNTPRPAINDALNNFNPNDEAPRVVPNNHFPMDPPNMVWGSSNGIFAVSPPGTRPDCFRHYEFLMAGNIVYVPDDPSLRIILSGLPVVFIQNDMGAGWGHITCDAMAKHARYVHQRLQDGLRQETVPAFNYAKLMLPYWSRFIRDVVWKAAEELQQSHNGTLYEDYPSAEDSPVEMIIGLP